MNFSFVLFYFCWLKFSVSTVVGFLFSEFLELLSIRGKNKRMGVNFLF